VRDADASSFENHIVPENIPLDIVYEDDTLLLINKARNGCSSRTWKLYGDFNALAYHFDNLMNSSERPGLVHRIDKDTSDY
jgi:23S rRNA pseudouridine1911/1915/1917 synthase